MKKKIFIAGHGGLAGSALLRELKKNKYYKIYFKTRKELNLFNYKAVLKYFKKEKFNHIYLAAAKSGGIMANIKYPLHFIEENLIIQNNLIKAAYQSNVEKFLFLGSSCIYPKNFRGKIKETDFLSDKLEESNQYYAIAKIAGVKLCEAYNKQYNFKTKYIPVMPCNLFGKNDNFNLENAHVVAALLRKIYNAKKNNLKEIIVFGDGTPKREFLNSEELARACIFLMRINFNKIKKFFSKQHHIINVGYGSDMSIKSLVNYYCKILEYKGKITFDKTKPNGTIRKLMDSTIINKLGWRPRNNIYNSLKTYVEDYIKLI